MIDDEGFVLDQDNCVTCCLHQSKALTVEAVAKTETRQMQRLSDGGCIYSWTQLTRLKCCNKSDFSISCHTHAALLVSLEAPPPRGHAQGICAWPAHGIAGWRLQLHLLNRQDMVKQGEHRVQQAEHGVGRQAQSVRQLSGQGTRRTIPLGGCRCFAVRQRCEACV